MRNVKSYAGRPENQGIIFLRPNQDQVLYLKLPLYYTSIGILTLKSDWVCLFQLLEPLTTAIKPAKYV